MGARAIVGRQALHLHLRVAAAERDRRRPAGRRGVGAAGYTEGLQCIA